MIDETSEMRERKVRTNRLFRYIDNMSRTSLAVASFVLGCLIAGILVMLSTPSPAKPLPAYADANTVSSRMGNVLLVQQTVTNESGAPAYIGAPMAVLTTDSPTVDDMCNAAYAVNSFSSFNVQRDNAGLFTYCRQAKMDLRDRSYHDCVQDLTTMGRMVYNGAYGSGNYLLDSVFTNGHITRACHDDVYFGYYLRNGSLAQSVLFAGGK